MCLLMNDTLNSPNVNAFGNAVKSKITDKASI